MGNPIDTRYFRRFERVDAVRRIERGAELDVDGERLRIEVIRTDVMRLKISRSGKFDEHPTFAVCVDLNNVLIPSFTIEDAGDHVKISSDQMSITVQRNPFRIESHRADGSLIFESAVDADGKSWAYATLNDAFVTARRNLREDAFFGLGERSGSFNRKGRNFTLWNTDVLNDNTERESEILYGKGDPRAVVRGTDFDPYYVSIPFFYHMPHNGRAMAGFFFDNGYRGDFEFSDPLEYRVHFSGGQYTEYVFAGPEMREILSAYTWLTGRMQAPPVWALGHHQCRWFAYTQEAVEKLAAQHRAKRISCDAIWLDIDYMDGYRVFTWDKTRFPDHAAMFEKLREQGFRVITIIDPGVKYEPGYAVFDDGISRDIFCKTESGEIYVGQVWPGRTAFPDFARADARRWWGELNATHVRSGLAGIWNDMNEPATGDVPPDAMRFDHGRQTHRRFHNQFAMLMAMGTTEGLLSARPDLRTFVLSRAGSAGIQRYAANWMGDNCARWNHLWMSLPMALGFGVSGQPFVGADIGGFMENGNAELLVRWYQCGALTPFCRNHNSRDQVDKYPWVFGEAVEGICRAALDLRYRLMPYIYTSFIRASETGEPVQRPLIFDFQSDRTLRDLDDEYLFGEDLLVAPIYHQGETARQVYLPHGTWFHWFTGEKFNGRQWIVAPAPMDYIPLYARGGAVIPMWETAPPSTMNYQPETIELHIFLPDEDCEHTSLLQEDDGLTFAFRDGAFRRTEFILRRLGFDVTLEAQVSGNGYPHFARRQFRLIFYGAIRDEILVDDRRVTLERGTTLLANQGTAFRLEAKVSTTPCP